MKLSLFVFIALLALTVYLSPAAGVLVGTVVIFLIKEGCDCNINLAKSIEYEISNIDIPDNFKKKIVKSRIRMPILTANVLENHNEEIVDYKQTDSNKYPTLPKNSYDEVCVFTNDDTDILHKSERLKPMCSRIYRN